MFTRLDDLIIAIILPEYLSTWKGIIIVSVVFVAIVIMIILIPVTTAKFDYVRSYVASSQDKYQQHWVF